ncbi:MAG: ABC transporter ATP-binding protein [Gaiellaceae bacterium]
MAEVVFEGVGKRFGSVDAVRDLSLEVADGEFIVLVGPSGSGKTTALRMLAGLEAVGAGTIRIGERVVNEVSPKERDVAMVFQDYALYPQMTVRDNLAFALRRRKAPREEISQRVQRAADALELSELLDRRPRQLSGGQQQRVALGRALVRDPQVFLMDEPLSNLDAKLRVQTRGEIKRLQQEIGTTTVYVTHDQVEAMTLGRRVAVMRAGKVLQLDTPQRLYHQPRNLFVAAFIGSPTMNLVEAAVDGNELAFGQFRVPMPERRPAIRTNKVVLGIRPECFEDATFAQAGKPALDIEPSVVEELGSEVHALFPVKAPPVTAERLDVAPTEASLLLEAHSLFTARLDARTAARPGSPLKVAVDPERFHFFDPETGDNLFAAVAADAEPAPLPELAAR